MSPRCRAVPRRAVASVASCCALHGVGLGHLMVRILRIYTPTVVTPSTLPFLLGWALGSWAVTGSVDTKRAVFAALSVLVMGYPYAVGIAAVSGARRAGVERRYVRYFWGWFRHLAGGLGLGPVGRTPALLSPLTAAPA